MMLDRMVENLVKLKQEFAKNYSGHSHIQEIIPISSTKDFPIDENHLEYLHDFIRTNPIYHNAYEQNIANIPCQVYEGDINEYWLNSIKHGSSCQPFYPTWVLSAYILALNAKIFGYSEAIDIGSGDGRIAYCSKIIGLNSSGIEIDEGLVELQNTIGAKTKINFDPICTDAMEFEYMSLNLARPVFFIGGLPQMGGDILAENIIKKILTMRIAPKTCIVFAGTHSNRQLANNQSNGGWSTLIERHTLKVLKTISLPTVWTFDQIIDTPYIFTKFT